MCRLDQHELIGPTLAGDFRKNPIKRNLRIVRMAVLAGFNLLFCFLHCREINGDQLDTRPSEQFVAIEAAL